MKNVTFKKQALAVSIGLAFSAAGSVALADAVLFPVIQSNGSNLKTFIQLVNTATITSSAGAIINSSTSAAYGENLRFVFNYGTALTTTDPIKLSAGCTHIDLPGGTSDKDIMLFEASTGSGSQATQALPAPDGWGAQADKSFAPRLAAPWYGSLMVTNAWTGYQPSVAGAAAVGTGTWAGLSGVGANEGTLFGQAWVVDGVNVTMYAYNAINDPDQATSSAAPNTSATTSFNPNMSDQYLMGWVPTFSNGIVTRYWMFPFAETSAYGSTTIPSAVSMVVGANAANNNNSYNLVASGQTGLWDHNETFISGASTISVPCGGVNMPLSQMMASQHWNIVQHTGGVAHGDVVATTSPNAASTTYTRRMDAAAVYKQVSVAGTKAVSWVSEPGVRTNIITAMTAPSTFSHTVNSLTAATSAAASVKDTGHNIATRKYFQ